MYIYFFYAETIQFEFHVESLSIRRAIKYVVLRQVSRIRSFEREIENNTPRGRTSWKFM